MIDQALLSLRPGAEWTLNGDTYEGLVWLDTAQQKPTLEEINEEIAKLTQDWQDKQYQRDRAQAYPSFADQFDLLYHGGFDSWKQVIRQIKDSYPKG